MQPRKRMDFDMCQCPEIVAKVRDNEAYAQNLYAAMCNREWQYQDTWVVLKNERWSCSWRAAGEIVADIRGEGDYLDWYCSGMGAWNLDNNMPDGYVAESVVTSEIQWDLEKIGWHLVDEVGIDQ